MAVPFTDAGFPRSATLQWQRAKVLWPHASLYHGSVTRLTSHRDEFTTVQGSTGDCSLIALIAAMKAKPGLLTQIFTACDVNQGRFELRVFRYPPARPITPYTLVLDDFLPVDAGGQLSDVACSSSHPGELYGLLLEKAIAKISEAWDYSLVQMDDPSIINKCWHIFTGGKKIDVSMTINNIREALKWLNETPSGKAFPEWPHCALANPLQLQNKVVTTSPDMHVYTVLGLREVSGSSNIVTELVWLRNPHGRTSGDDWIRGDWCNASANWNDVTRCSNNLRELYLRTGDDNNGQFHVTLQEFKDEWYAMSLYSLDTTPAPIL